MLKDTPAFPSAHLFVIAAVLLCAMYAPNVGETDNNHRSHLQWVRAGIEQPHKMLHLLLYRTNPGED